MLITNKTVTQSADLWSPDVKTPFYFVGDVQADDFNFCFYCAPFAVISNGCTEVYGANIHSRIKLR